MAVVKALRTEPQAVEVRYTRRLEKSARCLPVSVPVGISTAKSVAATICVIPSIIRTPRGRSRAHGSRVEFLLHGFREFAVRAVLVVRVPECPLSLKNEFDGKTYRSDD